ncbi:MAG: hypothetical protein HXY24_12695 [Rubrivivax sp.]|nr:hypothetical protein [Rubrivivax sp.]
MAAFVLLSIIPSAALAQAQSTNSDAWQFTLSPYLLFPRMDGKTAVNGREVEVDVSAGEIFENLQFGMMGYFEARKSKWGFGIDALYMALGTDVDRPSSNVDFDQAAFTFVGLRQLHEKVDLYFGARWNVLRGQIEFKGPVLLGTFKETKQFVDPLVGLKLKQPLGGRWNFTVQGDIGGFGAGSDFAWHLLPAIGFDVNERITLGAGYRVLSMDYKTSSADEMFEYDVVTQAIVLGANIHF